MTELEELILVLDGKVYWRGTNMETYARLKDHLNKQEKTMREHQR